MTEPTTAAGLYLYHGIAIRGQEDKALRSILAIEAEARAAEQERHTDCLVSEYQRGYAAALDEARAAVQASYLSHEDAGYIIAAIDALREDPHTPGPVTTRTGPGRSSGGEE